MNKNFIMTSDRETAAKLKKLGFSVVSENKGIITFVNKTDVPVDFSAGEKVVYTNKVSL